MVKQWLRIEKAGKQIMYNEPTPAYLHYAVPTLRSVNKLQEYQEWKKLQLESKHEIKTFNNLRYAEMISFWHPNVNKT